MADFMWKHSPTREILIAVEKARCTVQSVPGVVDGRTLKKRERESVVAYRYC